MPIAINKVRFNIGSPHRFGAKAWSRGLFWVVPAALCACSTTEEQVRQHIEVAAANEVHSERWTAAVDELAAIGRPGARQLLAHLDPALYRGVDYREFRDEIENTRTAAAVVLGRIRHKAASASMHARITTAYRHNERVACLRGVGDLGFTEAAVTNLKAQLADADPVIRLLAAVALVKIGEMSARDPIVAAVVDGGDELAEMAIEELEGANYHGVPILVDLLARQEGRRERLSRALGMIREQLVRQLDDDDPEIRRESAAGLGEIADPMVVEPLLRMLEDPSNLVRFNAAAALVRLGDRRGTEFLFGALDHTDAVLRLNAIKSLVRLQQVSRQVEGRLLECLRSDSPRLRSGAAQILGQAKVASAVDELLSTADDANPEVRCNVVVALGHIAAPASRATLERLAGDADETVAYYAGWALEQL